MISQTRLEIQTSLSRYLHGESTLQQFEDWFMPVLWRLAEQEDSEDRRLAGTIANLISEYADGAFTEQSLANQLTTAIQPLVGAGKTPLDSVS